MQKSVLVSLVFSFALIIGTLLLISGGSGYGRDTGETSNSQIRDGVQYVTIVAKGGYSPRISEIQAGVPTNLVVKTTGTYDCSAALIIRSAGFRKMLKPSGEEVIDLGILKPNDKVQGVCGMGMYSFLVKAS